MAGSWYRVLITHGPLEKGRYTQVKSETMEKDIQANGNSKKAEITIFISDQIDFKIKATEKTKALYNDKGINTRRGY